MPKLQKASGARNTRTTSWSSVSGVYVDDTGGYWTSSNEACQGSYSASLHQESPNPIEVFWSFLVRKGGFINLYGIPRGVSCFVERRSVFDNLNFSDARRSST